MRRSSGNPALLKASEQRLALVTEAKARELLVPGGSGLATQFSPVSTIEPGGLRDELLSPGRILLPPFVVGRRAPVAQQIGIPVLAATDAAVARLESTNAALHVVVCPGEVLPVIALHQVRPQVGEHLQELTETLPLQLAKRAIGQKLGHLCAPHIQAASHRRVAHALSLLCPVAVQEVFDREHPAMHALDLRQLLCPGGPLGHDRLQARQLLRTARAYNPPFFESCCRLASTSSNRSAASTVAYLKGCSPSVLRPVKIPAA